MTCREQRTSTVVLGAMNDAASVGDYLMPFDPNDVLEKNALARQGRCRSALRPAAATR